MPSTAAPPTTAPTSSSRATSGSRRPTPTAPRTSTTGPEATALLASTGPDGGDGNANATYAGNSADGGAVYFHTDERLDSAADGDGVQDVYRRQAGGTTLISTGEEGADAALPALFRWASPDGSSAAVIFTTAEPLSAADEDGAQDVYERNGTSTTLLSAGDPSCAGSDCGNGAFDANFTSASADGSHVFFVTDERLVEDEPLAKGDADDQHRRIPALRRCHDADLDRPAERQRAL